MGKSLWVSKVRNVFWMVSVVCVLFAKMVTLVVSIRLAFVPGMGVTELPLLLLMVSMLTIVSTKERI